MANNNSELGGCLVVITLVLPAIVAGYISWNWIEPDGFFGFILFMFVWGVLGKIFSIIFMAIAAIIFDGKI